MTIKHPKGCVCYSSGDWSIIIPPVCDSFHADEDSPLVCRVCEHDKACHKKENL